MRVSPLLLAALVLALPDAAGAEQREIVHMADIMGAVGENTWVVFDIDNTLISPKRDLGSDQWYTYLVDQMVGRDHLERAKAIDAAMDIWNAVQSDIEVAPVESATPELIRALQKRGVPTLALTARTADIGEVTKKQLASAGISFSTCALGTRTLVLDEAKGARLTSGILFIGEKSEKGPMLVRLLTALKAKPKRVVFVDDKQKHVDTVERAVAGAGIEARVFRYGAADARVKAFDGSATEAEYAAWKKSRGPVQR